MGSIHDQLLKNIDQNLQSWYLFLDLPTAFNLVDHDLIVKKLE